MSAAEADAGLSQMAAPTPLATGEMLFRRLRLACFRHAPATLTA